MKNRIGIVLQDLVKKWAENPNLSRPMWIYEQEILLKKFVWIFQIYPCQGRQEKYYEWYTVCLEFQKSLIRSYTGDYQQGTEPLFKW